MDQSFARQLGPLASFGICQLAFAARRVQLVEAVRVRMESDKRIQQVECDIDRLTVAENPLGADKLTERLALDEFSDEVPVAVAGLARPVDLHHVGVMDLPQSADLTAHRHVTSGIVEELECSLFIFQDRKSTRLNSSHMSISY